MNAYRDQYAQLFKGGRGVVLIALSVDVDTAEASWARDAEFPFLFASDTGSAVGRLYGATISGTDRSGKAFTVDNRTLFVIGPDGRIAHVMAPFREIDPTAYTELSGEIGKLTPADTAGG